MREILRLLNLVKMMWLQLDNGLQVLSRGYAGGLSTNYRDFEVTCQCGFLGELARGALQWSVFIDSVLDAVLKIVNLIVFIVKRYRSRTTKAKDGLMIVQLVYPQDNVVLPQACNIVEDSTNVITMFNRDVGGMCELSDLFTISQSQLDRFRDFKGSVLLLLNLFIINKTSTSAYIYKCRILLLGAMLLLKSAAELKLVANINPQYSIQRGGRDVMYPLHWSVARLIGGGSELYQLALLDLAFRSFSCCTPVMLLFVVLIRSI